MPDTLTFQEQSHIYRSNGVIVPSVTQVLRRVNLCPATDNEFALSRGRAVHTACAQWEAGTLDDAALDPRVRPYLTGWQKFCAENAWESTLIEKPLASSAAGFAGTPDRLGLRGTVPSGLDIKCGPPASWHVYQDAGYSILASEAKHLSLLAPWMNVYLDGHDHYRVVQYSLAQMHHARMVFAAALLVCHSQEGV